MLASLRTFNLPCLWAWHKLLIVWTIYESEFLDSGKHNVFCAFKKASNPGLFIALSRASSKIKKESILQLATNAIRAFVNLSFSQRSSFSQSTSKRFDSARAMYMQAQSLWRSSRMSSSCTPLENLIRSFLVSTLKQLYLDSTFLQVSSSFSGLYVD